MTDFALIDERLVEDTLLLQRRLGMPYLKRREPVIDPGQSFGPVLRGRDGRWTMWYIVYVTRDPTKYLVGVETPQCIAYSDDGLTWEKPALNIRTDDPELAAHPNSIVAAHQCDRNGRDISGHGGWSGLDILDAELTPHPCARARYTGLTTTFPTDTIGGLCLMDSDDGVQWTFRQENPIIIGSADTQNTLIWDAKRAKYVCFLRPTIHCGMAMHANRKIARSESEDLVHWTPPRVVIDTDERDAPAFDVFDEPGMGGFIRGRNKQFQGLSPFLLNDLYIAFTWFYDVAAGTFVNELLHSADGVTWQREALREPFVAAGRPEGFHGKLIVPAAGAPVAVGEELYFYLSATPYDHHEIAVAAINGSAAKRNALLETTSIYALALKRDRWVGYAAGEREGELLTTPIEGLDARAISLNLEIASGGYVNVEVADAWGRPVKDYHLDEVQPIAGPLDAVDHPFTFGPGPKRILRVPPIGPIRLRFRLKHATLYGWRAAALANT